MEHVNTLCEKNGEFPNVTGSGIYIYHTVLKILGDLRVLAVTLWTFLKFHRSLL